MKRKSVRRTHAAATETSRPLASGSPRDRGYPTLSEARRSSGGLVRRALALAASAGLLSVGCADPVCAPTASTELKTHAEIAVDHALALEGGSAVEALAIGLGIKPHPAGVALAGEAPAVVLPPPTAP
jgi:hypothetical protein